MVKQIYLFVIDPNIFSIILYLTTLRYFSAHDIAKNAGIISYQSNYVNLHKISQVQIILCNLISKFCLI